MHTSSLINMQEFKEKYLGNRVLDVGSRDVNGSYREIFDGYEYVGIDIVSGKGVDVVGWDTITEESFDYVISGQTFEHIEDDVFVMMKIAVCLKKGGICCIIAPSQGPKHNYPNDYRRYQPEDFIKLAEQVGLEVIEAKINGEAPWFDCVFIGRKN